MSPTAPTDAPHAASPTPPGEMLAAWLRERSMPLAVFSRRMHLTEETCAALMDGIAPIDDNTARRLERVTGASAAYWRNLEAAYRRALA